MRKKKGREEMKNKTSENPPCHCYNFTYTSRSPWIACALCSTVSCTQAPRGWLVNDGSCHPHFLVDVLLIQRKRLVEHPSQLPNFLLKSFLVRPSQTGIQQFPGNAFKRSRYRQVKSTKRLELRLGQLPGVNSVHDNSRIFERTTFARAKFASSPASIYEPAVDLMFRHALCQHVRITTRLKKKSNYRR